MVYTARRARSTTNAPREITAQRVHQAAAVANALHIVTPVHGVVHIAKPTNPVVRGDVLIPVHPVAGIADVKHRVSPEKVAIPVHRPAAKRLAAHENVLIQDQPIRVLLASNASIPKGLPWKIAPSNAEHQRSRFNHEGLPTNPALRPSTRTRLILNDMCVTPKDNCLTLLFQTLNNQTIQFEAHLDLQAILASIAASQSTLTPLADPLTPAPRAPNGAIRATETAHLHDPAFRKAIMYDNFDFNVCPPVTQPTRGCFPPPGLPRTSGGMAQNMVNVAALLCWFDVVWYFAMDPKREFGATITSVFYEGRTLRYNCLVIDPKTGRRERRAELSELYVESAHAVGMSMLLPKKEGIPANTPKADAYLYPCTYADRRNDFIASIFVVTEFRGVQPAPLHANLASAVKLSDLFGRITGLYFRADPDRCIKAIKHYQAFLTDAQFGELAPLFALARQARPPCLMVAERVGLAGEVLKVHDGSWHRNPCKIASILPPQLGETLLTTVDMTAILARAKIAAAEAYPKAEPPNKKDTVPHKGRRRVTKASESVRGATAAIRLARQTCPCQVVPQLPEGARGTDMVLSACSTRLQYVVDLLPQAHVEALDNVSQGLACFEKLQFPLCQPPVCWDALRGRYVALDEVTIFTAIQEPTSRLAVELSTLQEATVADPVALRALMVESKQKFKANVSSQHRRESVLRGRRVRTAANLKSKEEKNRKRARSSSHDGPDATQTHKSVKGVTVKTNGSTNTKKPKQGKCEVAQHSVLPEECRNGLEEVNLEEGRVHIEEEEKEIHKEGSSFLDANGSDDIWDHGMVPPLLLMEFGGALLANCVGDDQPLPHMIGSGDTSSFDMLSRDHNSTSTLLGVVQLQSRPSMAYVQMSGARDGYDEKDYTFKDLDLVGMYDLDVELGSE
jgi:hypothetical protein